MNKKTDDVNIKKQFIVAGILISVGITLEVCIALLAQIFSSRQPDRLNQIQSIPVSFSDIESY